MIFLDVLYTGIATVCVLIIVQIVIFLGVRIVYPPPPKIIYRDIPVLQQPVPVNIPVLTERSQQEIKLPEYEPRQQTSDSLRLDAQLPPGLQETRPEGL